MALESDYQALVTGPALVDRSYRALLEVEGADRATWLHNLTTNQVKNLGRGEGNYAFVLNVQGRILFDANVLARADSIWLDLDRRFLDTAKKHFSKYTISEDVTVFDRSDEFARFGLVGRDAPSILTELGAPNAATMAQLSQTVIPYPNGDPQAMHPSRDGEGAGGEATKRRSDEATKEGGMEARRHEGTKGDRSRDRMPFTSLSDVKGEGADPGAADMTIGLVRHDFCESFGVELFVPSDRAAEFRRILIDRYRAVPVSDEAVQVRRIEAGIPWPGHEITNEYLPAETRQLERAVSYQKGCYLGQEVVERMRSRGVVARQLVGLRMGGSDVPPLKSQIFSPSPLGEGRGEGGNLVGTVTSSCQSPSLGCPIALAYVRTPSSAAGTALHVAWDGGSAQAVVVNLPLTPHALR